MMMFPSENDLMLMDENEYRDHMLLTSLDDDDEHDVIPAALVDEDTAAVSMTFDQEEAKEFTTLCRKVTDTHEEEGSTEKINYKFDDNDTKPTAPASSSDDVPGEYDVMCGQSRNCASHSGNKRFQSILDSYAPSYSKVNKKEEKMALTKEIVSKIQQFGGRFLKKDNKAGGAWVEISDVAARDKISHALRTKVSSWKKRVEREAKESTASSTTSSSRPTHRRKSTAAKRQRHRRRSSCNSTTSSSVNTFASHGGSSFDTVPTPMSSASSSVMEELMRKQREIFASLVAESEIECKEGEIHPLKRE